MLSINFLKKNRAVALESFNKRGFSFDYDFFYKLDLDLKSLKTYIYLLKREYNLLSSLYVEVKKYNNILNVFLLKLSFLKKKIVFKESELKELSLKFNKFIDNVPNLLHKSVPHGLCLDDNIEVRTYINSKNLSDNFIFDLFNDIENNNFFLDFDSSSRISGSGFVVLKKSLAELHRAIGNYMIDKHVYLSGYEEIYSPVLVKSKSMYNSGHFPKFCDDQFSLSENDLWLIPTSEVVLTNLVANSFLDINKLPLKFVSKTLCFRKEKGNYGYLVKGLIRQHQFDKVELVHVVTPEKSYDSLDELVYNAESILQDLDLSYRVLSLCSMDIGFASSKTYDLEVWMPKRKIYLEVSSCSNTEDFQSRRMNAKIQHQNKLFYPHILNGSGLAIGRILLAILENYSDSSGNLFIPTVLVKYMNGVRKLNFF